jgi:hypothetical protein
MFDHGHRDFPVLRFMAMLKAARDLGLEQHTADAVALSFDPRRPDVGHIADTLASALLQQGALAVPDAV